MWIKICGLKQPENIARIADLKPAMMGFIFYPRSPRYAGGLDPRHVRALPAQIRRAGVFVDAKAEEILDTVRRYGLDTVQLHGEETPAFCERIRREGLTVIKAVGIAVSDDIRKTDEYHGACDLLLFDTKSPARGGTGRRFDWTLLENYRETTPFLLSGGIGAEHAEDLTAFSHPQCAGLDLNSRFETEPGVKDAEALRDFIRSVQKD